MNHFQSEIFDILASKRFEYLEFAANLGEEKMHKEMHMLNSKDAWFVFGVF